MIILDVRITGVLIKPDGKKSFKHSCREGISAKELLRELGYRDDHIKYIKIFVDSVPKNPDFIFRNNCSLVLSTVAGGG